jgi:hypothetical protein
VKLNAVGVHDSQAADSASGQVERHRGAQAPGSHDQHRALAELLLSRNAEGRKEKLAAVALNLITSQAVARTGSPCRSRTSTSSAIFIHIAKRRNRRRGSSRRARLQLFPQPRILRTELFQFRAGVCHLLLPRRPHRATKNGHQRNSTQFWNNLTIRAQNYQRSGAWTRDDEFSVCRVQNRGARESEIGCEIGCVSRQGLGVRGALVHFGDTRLGRTCILSEYQMSGVSLRYQSKGVTMGVKRH